MQNSLISTKNPHGQPTRKTPKPDENEYSFTSFTPLSPEDTKGTFSFSKLFQWKSSEQKHLPKPSESVAASKNEPKPKSVPSSASAHGRSTPSLKSKIPRSWSSPRFQRRQGSGLSGSPGQGKQLPQGYRNLSALLKRLSAAADQPSQQYKESHFKQYWMPDEHCKECYECGEKFNTFRRRHHCRLCGQIFCYRCCNIEIKGEVMGYSGGLRVCTYCNKIFQTYTQSPDMLRNLEQLQADIQAVSMETDYSLPHSSSLNTLNIPRSSSSPFDEDDKYSLPSSRKTSSSSTNSMLYIDKLEPRESRPQTTMANVRSPFDAFGVCAAEANMLKQDSLREIWHMLMSKRSGLELQSHRFRLKNYQNCFVATDLVEWLITHEKAMTRSQAVAIGQALLESGWLEPVPQTRDVQEFSDEYSLYQPGPVALKDQAGNLRSFSRLYLDSSLKGESVNDDSEDENEDDDETAPQWFRQLPGYDSGEELDVGESVEVDPVAPAGILNVPKHTRASGAKLLDLDATTAPNEEEEESELSLKVNLEHFGEGKTGASEGQSIDNQGPTLALTTDVPPPPLEQYVYTEGYPITSLRAPYYRKASETPLLATSSEDVLKGAMMAKRIGVDRPKPNDPKTLRDDNNERLAMERISNSRNIHGSRLVEQLLKDAGLSLEWKDVIMPLVTEISLKVAPDVHNSDDMDIRQYVKFKKIPGGKKRDCDVVWGVGFTKNVSNKKMCSSFLNPRILVLCCAIDYQRKENRLASLDPLILQENEFLKNFVARVAALRPNVLLVEKTVSRLAQDMLLQHGITLALNVKPKVIERVARCTKADILRSMEQLSRPHLGTCQQFRVHKYTLKNGETKTLMFFDGCPPELGCTVSLRGGNRLVLAKVKKIVQFVTYVAYSQKLETAFLMDEFALPEEPVQLSVSSSNDEDLKIETNKTAEKTNDGLDARENLDEAAIFQQALDRTVLSSSPYVRYPLPYLLTPEGVGCAVRSCLPKEIYWSGRLANERQGSCLTEKELEEFELPNPKRNVNKSVQILEAHPFVTSNLVVNSNDQFILGVVADFRSQGGRILLKRRNVEYDGRRKSKWLLLESEEGGKENKVDTVDGKKRQGDDIGRKNQKVSPLEVKRTSQDSLATPIHFNRKIDCLDPNYHQRIAVLFSSYSSESNNSPRPCISPWAVFMEFYGRNDITLGGFLERYCFRPSYVCPNPNCDIPMVDHVRYFAHGNGSVYIHMKNLESPIPGFQHTILTWSWCKECKQVTPIVPLSPDAWALSFAKYIELRFYADQYTRRASVEPCGHSLHRHHFQYFAYANMVASFKYRAIKLYETAIPPPSISVKDEVRDAAYWVQDVEAISTRGDTVFASILERLDTLKAAKLDFHAPERDSKLAQFTVQLEEDHARFTEQVQAVEKRVTVLQSLQNPQEVSSFDQRDQQALGYVIADGVNGLKRILCEYVESWNNRLQEFIQVEKKRTSKTGNQRDVKPGEKTDNGLSTKSVEDFRDLSEDPPQFAFLAPGLSPGFSPFNSRNVSPFVTTEGSDSDLESQVSDLDSSRRHMYFSPVASSDDGTKKDSSMSELEESLAQDNSSEDAKDDANEAGDGRDQKDERKPFVRGHRRVMSYPLQISMKGILGSFDDQAVDALRMKKNTEGLVRSKSDSNVSVFEKEAEIEDETLLDCSTYSSPSTTLAQKEKNANSDFMKWIKIPLSMPDTAAKKNTEQDSPGTSVDGIPAMRRRDKMKNIISSFLPGSTFQPVSSSFPSHEHHLLPPGERVVVVISEREPSSIIAYSLSTKDYNHRLCEIQASLARLTMGTNSTLQEVTIENKEKNPQVQVTESYEDSRIQSSASSVISVEDTEEDFVNVEIKDVNDIESCSSTEYVEIIEDIQDPTPVRIKRTSTLERQDKVKFSKSRQGQEYNEAKGQTYIHNGEGFNQDCSEQSVNSDLGSLSEFGFQPSESGKDHQLDFHIQMQFSYNVCRFYCNAYYAEQFRKLRKHTFTDGEERYIRSLAHCVVWRARGGKSGSSFSKSLDDRFVLKQMSRLELQSFVEFAPHYFQYMNKAIKEKRSTLLAKIFGVYRIGFKNTQTNTTMRQDVLIMENLFYDRKIDKIFDLKGSMRSRYVQVSGRENDVLMDENLLEMIREYPIFIRPHSKAVLSKAIHNDTEFLAHHMVMDYSLLVGIDELRSELVIGIIDFIRTFTWDKKLEMYVKSSGILGGQGKMPTVVSPELYRTRFSEAMQRYFLMVPDKWTGLGNDLD